MLSFEQQNQNSNASAQSAQSQPQMRLRDEIPQINQPAQRNGRKRKSPPTNPEPQPPPQPPQPQSQQTAAPQNLQHVLPAHLMHHSFPFAGPPPGSDYTPAGIPPQPNAPHQNPSPSQDVQQPSTQQQQQQQPPATTGAGRQLSNSKRAEQNRKAQRAFRERRDQHVKALESRSQLLDAALASADEANRRWEECRALVDQLRVENATLRAALSQHVQVLPIPPVIPGQEQAQKAEGGNKPESGEAGVKSN